MVWSLIASSMNLESFSGEKSSVVLCCVQSRTNSGQKNELGW